MNQTHCEIRNGCPVYHGLFTPHHSLVSWKRFLQSKIILLDFGSSSKVAFRHSREEPVGDGLGRGHTQLALLVPRRGRRIEGASAGEEGLADLLDREPLGDVELLVVELDGLAAGDGLADGADHQARGVGPRLGGVDDDAADLDARLLPDLAPDALLEGLARLEEAGEGAVEMGRVARLAAEEDPLAVRGDDGGDHGGVRPGEADVGDTVAGWAVVEGDGLLCPLQVRGRAHALVAGVDGEVGVAAAGAEAVAGVPVDHGSGLGVHGGFGVGKARSC